MAGITLKACQVGGKAMFNHTITGLMAVNAFFRRFAASDKALHCMAITAFHTCLSMNIRQHLQEGLSLHQLAPLITKTVFPGGHAVIIRSDKVPFVAAKTTIVRGPGDVVPVLTVTV
jgi:hypothetical protein